MENVPLQGAWLLSTINKSMRLLAEVAVPFNVTQIMKYSVHHMQICELWRYYLNYRAIVDFDISDTASPAFNCSNSDLCV